MRTSERVVVIGGTGFIGTPLVQALISGGHLVTVVGRHERPVPLGARFIVGEVADSRRMMEVIRGATLVYHLGTGGGKSWTDFIRDFIEGTRNVAEACLHAGVRRVIYASSIAAVYLGRASTIMDATPTDDKPNLRSLYSRGKIAAEAELHRLRLERKLPFVILRPGVVLGKGGILEHSGVGQWPADTRCIGWGSGTNPLPLVLVDDVVDALLLAATAAEAEGRAFNIVGDVCLTAREYVALCARVSFRDYRFYPRRLAYLQTIEIAKWALKALARKPENPFPSYRDLKSRSFRSTFDNAEAKRILGWKPTADVGVLIDTAMKIHIKPIAPGDLRRLALEQ